MKILVYSSQAPLHNFNAASYWKNSNTEVSVKKLSKILANNIDTGEGFGLRIYVRCRRLLARMNMCLYLNIHFSEWALLELL